MGKIPWYWVLLCSIICILKCEAENDEIQFVYHECMITEGNITDVSSYENNRNVVLTKLYSDEETGYGFYNASYGEEPDKVYAVGMCRGDVKPEPCHRCLDKSAVLLRDRCSKEKGAIGWFEECMVRYSIRSIFEQEVTDVEDIVHCNYINATNKEGYDEARDELVDRLKIITAEGDDYGRKVAEEETPVKSSNETVYALLQCVPYLSYTNCTQCLSDGMARIRNYCNGMTSGKYRGRSCSIRYESYLFYGPIFLFPPPPLSPPLPSPITVTTTGKNKRLETIIAIVVSVVGVAVVALLLLYYKHFIARKQKPIQSEVDDEVKPDNDIKTDELLQFDFTTIERATNNFSDANKLGQGGYGIVYKGTLSDGQEIAIKRLSINSNQGETEFKNEIVLTGKLRHRNLVRLLGFCFARRERLLIYEFVPNKSLDYFLLDPNKRSNLTWENRSKIIRGIARGLLYLHEDSPSQIVHRDLKTSNILLDEELNPKISDFGLARLFDINQSQVNTSTIVGTRGYMAPEYMNHGHFSVKSDVFSFGVIIIEMICGQRNREIGGINAQDLLSFAWENWLGDTVSNILDPTLKGYSWNELRRYIQIGLLCVQENIVDRPTMDSVLLMLNSISFPLPEPSFLMRGKSSLPLSGEAATSNQSAPSDKEPITQVNPR